MGCSLNPIPAADHVVAGLGPARLTATVTLILLVGMLLASLGGAWLYRESLIPTG